MNNEMKEIVINKAHELYGNPLPKEIEERLDLELRLIEKNGLDTIYYLAKKLVDKEKEREYLVSNRGNIGCSFVAYLLGITEINPLSKNYGGFDIPFELQKNIEKDNKIKVIIAVSTSHYDETCNDMEEIIKSENIKVDIDKNTKAYRYMYKRLIKSDNSTVLGSLEIQTSYHLKILEELYKMTQINPMQIEVESDITKIGDILIKNKLFTGIDIIKLVDVMQEIELTTFDDLIKMLELIYNINNYISPKSHMVERALKIYKIGWYGVQYEKEFNEVINTEK